jgi:hypothetical protein
MDEPSKNIKDTFIWAHDEDKVRVRSRYTEQMEWGKWLFFPGDDEIDALWEKIKTLQHSGVLGPCSKASTRLIRSFYNSYVICVYTEVAPYDMERVLRVLEHNGLHPARYKTDRETMEEGRTWGR